jgi:hypothetical protein
MRHRSLTKGLLAVTAIGAVVGATHVASAQLAAVGSMPNPTRRFGVRVPQQKPYWVNRQDCLNKDVMTFTFTLTGAFTSYSLEVWAGGSDCSQTTSRIGTTATCWKVASGAPTVTPFSIDINVMDVVAQNKPDSTVPTNDQGVKPGTLANCTSTASTPPQPIILDFMLVTEASGAAQTGHQIFNTGIDIWGPSAPTGVTAGQGETRLHLDWTRSTSADIIGYNIYCDPPQGAVSDASVAAATLLPPFPGLEPLALDSGAGGAGGFAGTGGIGGTGGFTFDAGVGGTTTTVDAGVAGICSAASPLSPGRQPDTSLSQYLCGHVDGIQATNATVENLVNDVTYAVAVAGVDQVANEGPLSNQTCQSPQEVTDFFELYRAAGGGGGGGLCSVGSRPGGPLSGVVLSGVAALWLARRRKRRA